LSPGGGRNKKKRESKLKEKKGKKKKRGRKGPVWLSIFSPIADWGGKGKRGDGKDLKRKRRGRKKEPERQVRNIAAVKGKVRKSEVRREET